MKKVLAILVALTLMLSMSTAALAADITSNNGSQSGNVYVQVTGTENVGDVYAVNISWDSLTFVFKATGWDSTSLHYDGSWTTKTRDITVTNHSNVAITTTNSLSLLNETNGTSASITEGASFDLGIGASDTITLTAAGYPTVENSTFQIGTVLISIAKK